MAVSLQSVIFLKRKYDQVFAVHITFNGSSLLSGSSSKHLIGLKFPYNVMNFQSLKLATPFPALGSFPLSLLFLEHLQPSNFLLISAPSLFMSQHSTTISRPNCVCALHALIRPYHKDTITTFTEERRKPRHRELREFNDVFKVSKLDLRSSLQYLL